MNVKLKDKKILDVNVKTFDLIIGEFNKDLVIEKQKEIIETINCGYRFIQLYKFCRDNLHISNVVIMIEEMEKIYSQYDKTMYECESSKKKLFGE